MAADRNGLGALGMMLLVSVACPATTYLIGSAVAGVAGDRNAPWLLGRAAGLTAYTLLVLLVLTGLVLSHPWRARVRRPSSVTRLRMHVGLAAFTAAFTVLHVVVLATDHYAGVGWSGAFLPQAATYRPVAITLGVLGFYAGLLAGLTAALSGRVAMRLWWPIHKVAVVSLVLVWAHAVTAGSDAAVLKGTYLVTGLLVLIAAVSRYGARTPADRIAELTAPARTLAGGRR